jgi:PQQ enzyme repeat
MPRFISVAAKRGSLGGPLATTSGLVFIGAALDGYLRAFDTKTGAEMWTGRLPSAGIHPDELSLAGSPTSPDRRWRPCRSRRPGRFALPGPRLPTEARLTAREADLLSPHVRFLRITSAVAGLPSGRR